MYTGMYTCKGPIVNGFPIYMQLYWPATCHSTLWLHEKRRAT